MRLENREELSFGCSTSRSLSSLMVVVVFDPSYNYEEDVESRETFYCVLDETISLSAFSSSSICSPFYRGNKLIYKFYKS